VRYKCIDVDSHCQEQPTTWSSRMSKARWGDRIPHLEDSPDGAQFWVIDGKPSAIGRVALCHAVMPDRETLPKRWADVPKSVYDPYARMKAMDQDGVDAEVLYANITGTSAETFQGKEPDLEEECVRAYNDYLAEEWLAASKERFIPLAIVPYSDIERTVGELRRAVGRGLKGVVMLSTPHQRGLHHFNDLYWEPLWTAADDLGVPVHFHGSGGASRMRLEIMPDTTQRRNRALTGSIGFNLQAQFYTNMLMSGMLDRHPNLTFVCAESGLGWVPYLFEMADYEWDRCQLWKQGMPRKPSDIFKAQCYVDFWYEKAGLAYRQVIGVDRIMWETDFPHPTSIFPDSQKWLDWSLEGASAEDRRKILVDNPMKVYKLKNGA